MPSRPITRLITRGAAILGLSGAIAGCTLIDQRTFDPDAGKAPPRPVRPPPPPPVAPPLPGAPPLLSIKLPPPPDLADSVRRAVAAARARKPGVAFDVVEITPNATIGDDAAAIGRLITAAGIPPGRVALSVRPIPGVAAEVRVFVH